ncbi:MAG: 7,8-didemethyl-8-hydroxy-5-deazariboflavin synthase subunit CofG [Nitrospinota bacterium]
MRTVTYSRNFTLPITYWCRDRCGYCSFRSNDPVLMTQGEIREVARKEAAKGAVEALVMTGEAPDVHPKMRAELNSWGFPTYVDYVRRACEILLEEGLLPHTNIGTLSLDQLARLKDVNASVGVMLESLSPAVQSGVAHRFAPTKAPALRVETVRAAGELQIPFTSGILFGIGESREERTRTLEVLARLQEAYGHLQEVIVQPLNAQEGTPMADWPEPSKEEALEMVREARTVLPDDVHIQIPPNLIPHVVEAVKAGTDDLGGLSDEPDLINPNHPWPDIDGLRRHLAGHGIDLQLRLPVYDEFIERGWYSPTVGALMASFRPALFC